MSTAGATTLEDLGDWISEDYELDAEARIDHDTLVVRMGIQGVGIHFPITAEEFWESVDDLHDEMSAALESELGEPDDTASS